MGRRSADSRCHLRNVPLFLPRGFPLARFRDTTAAAYLGGAGLSTLVLGQLCRSDLADLLSRFTFASSQAVPNPRFSPVRPAGLKGHFSFRVRPSCPTLIVDSCALLWSCARL